MNNNNDSIESSIEMLPFSVMLETADNIKDRNKLRKDKFINVIYIKQGCLDIVIDYKIHKVAMGDVVFINSNTPYAILKDNASSFSFYCLSFSPEVVYMYGNDFFNIEYFLWLAINLQNPFYIYSDTVDTKIFDLFKETYEIYSKKDVGYEFEVHSNILFFCIWLYENWPKKQSYDFGASNNDVIILREIFSCVEKNLESQNYMEYVEKFNLKSSFFKLFKKLTGYTLYEYIEICKLSEAAFLLATSSIRVTDLAYLLGYASSAYFSKIFLTHMGMSPSKFRKNNSFD